MIKKPRMVKAGKPAETLEVLDAAITLNITPLSTASLTLREGTQIGVGEYAELFTQLGSAGVFRTRSPRTGIGGQTTTIELEHAITEMGDSIINDAIEAEMKLGDALKKIFTYYKGKSWKLGKIAKENNKIILNTDHENCLDAILSVLEQEPSLMLTFDFSKYPWTVNVATRPTAISAEGRLSRNVKTATITADDSELCTRVFMEGLKGTKDKQYGYIDADTKSKYGLVERVVSGSNYTEAQAERAAKLYLEKHKNPRISIQINAIDLSEITGEPLDKFEIGKKMRLAIPAHDIVAEETITQLSWSSVYRQPSMVTVSLSDEEDTVVQTLAKQAKAAGNNASKARKIIDESNEYWEQRVSKVVDEKGRLKTASIVLAINQDGSSEAMINADRIHLLGKTIADKIDANFIRTRIAAIPKISMIDAYASSLRIGKNITLASGLILEANAVWQLSLTQSGNTYTLTETKLNGTKRTVGTFSRAVSSWVWGAGNGKINVKALPQDQTKSVSVSIDGTNSISSNGNYTYKVMYENADGDDVETGASRTVNVNVMPTFSIGTNGYVNSTQNLPSGTKHELSGISSKITSNWSSPGFIYQKVTINGATHILYFATKGPS